MLKNPFFNHIQEAYQLGATKEELSALLGRGRAKKGMFEGDVSEGELEIGQISGLIHNIIPAAAVVDEIIGEYKQALYEQQTAKYNLE